MELTEELLIATGNAHKLGEIRVLLDGLPFNVKGLPDFQPIEPAVEDGVTFEENARKKARHYAAGLGVRCVADDSGLAVDALDGKPGVWSARYAGEDASDRDNNAKLLCALEGVPGNGRTARFVCCAVLCGVDGACHIETGVVEGRIAFEVAGVHRFGYDPLFIPNGYDRTFAELGAQVKQQISHRARAFTALRAYLESRL